MVNENDEIVSIYSNTAKTDCSFYSLTVREASTSGQDHPLTANILTKYNRLADSIDWSIHWKAF